MLSSLAPLNVWRTGVQADDSHPGLATGAQIGVGACALGFLIGCIGILLTMASRNRSFIAMYSSWTFVSSSAMALARPELTLTRPVVEQLTAFATLFLEAKYWSAMRTLGSYCGDLWYVTARLHICRPADARFVRQRRGRYRRPAIGTRTASQGATSPAITPPS